MSEIYGTGADKISKKKYPRYISAILDDVISEQWNNADHLYCLSGLKLLVNADVVATENQEKIIKQELLDFLKHEEASIWLFAMFLNTIRG
jgi:hypothetical protein